MIFLGKEVKNYGDPFIVAEISGNHGGDLNSAFSLISEAKSAGADAIKIQCYTADSLTIPNGYKVKEGRLWQGIDLYELYMEACTPFEWIAPLFDHARKMGIQIFSSVYDEKGLEVLEQVKCPAYKIASFEANDPLFIKKVAEKKKPIVVSTGMLNDDEIIRIANHLEPSEYEQLILMHCVSKYPCELNEISLLDMKNLMEDFYYPVGFSCHSDDPLAVCIAVALGAAIIEVHLTLDDEVGQESPDYEFSFTPEGLKYTIEKAKKVKQSLFGKHPLLENASRKLRRSLFVVEDIKKGDTFTNDNIKSFRPNLGCEPYLLVNILGRKANKDIKKFTPMAMEHVE